MNQEIEDTGRTLVEAEGGCWHEWKSQFSGQWIYKCQKCSIECTEFELAIKEKKNVRDM